MALIDPKRITDISKCLAIIGRRTGVVGFQCKRKPQKDKMCCVLHKALEADVLGITRDAINAARSEMVLKKKQLAKEMKERKQALKTMQRLAAL